MTRGMYIRRRLLLMLPTAFGVTLITFFMIHLIPGDPAYHDLNAIGDKDLATGVNGQAFRVIQLTALGLRTKFWLPGCKQAAGIYQPLVAK